MSAAWTTTGVWDVSLTYSADLSAALTLLTVPAGTFTSLDDPIWALTEEDPPPRSPQTEIDWLIQRGFTTTAAPHGSDDDVLGVSANALLRVLASPDGFTLTLAEMPVLVSTEPVNVHGGWVREAATLGRTVVGVCVDVDPDNLHLDTFLAALQVGAAVVADVDTQWSDNTHRRLDVGSA